MEEANSRLPTFDIVVEAGRRPDIRSYSDDFEE
jgi:hypothetical protein